MASLCTRAAPPPAVGKPAGQRHGRGASNSWALSWKLGLPVGRITPDVPAVGGTEEPPVLSGPSAHSACFTLGSREPQWLPAFLKPLATYPMSPCHGLKQQPHELLKAYLWASPCLPGKEMRRNLCSQVGRTLKCPILAKPCSESSLCPEMSPFFYLNW